MWRMVCATAMVTAIATVKICLYRSQVTFLVEPAGLPRLEPNNSAIRLINPVFYSSAASAVA
jgi:hypothetical protein